MNPLDDEEKQRYLLYIDILGFEDMVRNTPGKVDDLYQIVASLAAHRHPNFSVVVFSDTILVHNTYDPSDTHDHQYLVMYSCEFAQDLLYRLAGRGIFFRAILTYGNFKHTLCNGQHYYYGLSLINSYHAEKGVFKATGLIMDDKCAKYSNIFSHHRYAEGWNYVFLTRGLDTFEDTWGAMYPMLCDELESHLAYLLSHELETMHKSFEIVQSGLPDDIREKHRNTLSQFRVRYPKAFALLEPHEFRMEYVNRDFNWLPYRDALSESYEWAWQRGDAVSSDDK